MNKLLLSFIIPLLLFISFESSAVPFSILLNSVQKGDLGTLVMFLEFPDHKPQVDIADEKGLTLLHHAVINRQHHIITELLEGQHAYASPQSANLMTPLHYAASIGDIYSVSCLLENSANPNLESDSGLTPLHLSVKSNSLGVTDLLLSSHGINMNPRDDLYQMTPLQFAVSQALKTRNFAIVKVMMKTQGIDPDIEDALGLNVFAKAHLEGIELNDLLSEDD